MAEQIGIPVILEAQTDQPPMERLLRGVGHQVCTHVRDAGEIAPSDLCLYAVVDVHGENTQAAPQQPVHLTDAVLPAAHRHQRVVQWSFAGPDALDQRVKLALARFPVDAEFCLVLAFVRPASRTHTVTVEDDIGLGIRQETFRAVFHATVGPRSSGRGTRRTRRTPRYPWSLPSAPRLPFHVPAARLY